MRVVNIKELKARLSSYVRDVARGDVFLVTDRGKVVARLGPVDESAAPLRSDAIARLVAMGFRPPLRERRPTDYRRTGEDSGLDTATIDALLDDTRGDR